MYRPELEQKEFRIRQLVKADVLPKYKQALIEKLKELWAKSNLDPLDEIMFADGKTEFRAVALCTKKGFEHAQKDLTLPQITPDQARELMIKSLEQWNLQPVT